MTPGERLVATVRGRPVDRPSLPYWLGFTPWERTLERWRRESGIADLDVSVYFELDPWFHEAPLLYGPCPPFEPLVLDEDDVHVTLRDSQGIVRRNRKDGESMPHWISHPVGSADEWERYKAERLSGPLEARCPDLDRFASRVAQGGGSVQAGMFPWGTFGTLRDLVGVERCLLWFYDEPDLVRDIIDTNVELWLRLYRRAARDVRIDHIHIWEDMSGRQGSLISMAMVEEFLMPAYDRIVACAEELGAPIVSVDTDGECGELVEVMSRHGINAFMPFEVQAGNDILAFRARYPKLGILGGLDKSALAAGQARIHRELDKAQRMLALGAYVAGFDHAIPPDVPWDAFRYAMTELRRMAGA